MFAVLCIGFYAVAVREFQSAARYLPPALYALTLALGGFLARSVDRRELLLSVRVLVSTATVQLAAMLAMNLVAVAPRLRGFHDNYWQASRRAADSLATTARPGETVFAPSDIGIYYSRDKYRIVNGPGRATPQMVGLAPLEILRRSNARLVVEHYGRPDSDVFPFETDGAYVRVCSIPSAAAGLVSSEDRYSLNIYEKRAP